MGVNRGPLLVNCRLPTAGLERVSFEASRSLPWEIFVRDPNREVVFYSHVHIRNHDLTL